MITTRVFYQLRFQSRKPSAIHAIFRRLFRSHIAWLLLLSACLPVILIPTAQAAPVLFQVDRRTPVLQERFVIGSDRVLPCGTFNDWDGSSTPLYDIDMDTLYALWLDVPSGEHEFKYRLRLDEQYDIWEQSIGNRRLTVGSDSLVLPVVLFDDDATPPLPPRPVELYFQVNLSLPLLTGAFDPAQDLITVAASLPELGNWEVPGVILHATGDAEIWTSRVTLPALANYPVFYKYVLVRDGSVQWESLSNRSFRITGEEVDEYPAPGGDGVVELNLAPVYFNRQPGWQTEPVQTGADLSILPHQQYAGVSFSHAGTLLNPLADLQANGGDMVRLRLWHSPAEPWHGLDSTVAFAREVVSRGLELMLDFHYSDFWADPGQQTIPADWQGLAFSAVCDSIEDYTRRVISRFRTEGALPDVVQIGNEIDSGILWNLGRVGGEWDTAQQWEQLATLLNRAIAGVQTGALPDTPPQIMLHRSQGANLSGNVWFFDHLAEYNVEYDLIGLSYYPWWQGSLTDLVANLEGLTDRYGKPVQIVETAYPWTLINYDGADNFVWNSDQLPPNYPATPAGQQAFLNDLRSIIGLCDLTGTRRLLYWEPTMRASPSMPDNPVDNLALFDQEGEALPAWGDMHIPSEPPELFIHRQNGQIELWWQNGIPGTLWRVERARAITGPWETILLTTHTSFTEPTSGNRAFYRVTAVTESTNPGAPLVPSPDH